jgi:homoaconitase/3-isopropylmalate dehydratase large subunit
MMARTLFDKLWDAHVVRELGDGWALLHIDRHLLHDLSGPPALAELAARGLKVHNPELVFATPDHAVSSDPRRTGQTFAPGAKLYTALRDSARSAEVRFFDVGQVGQGIVHVMGPELGIVLPGVTVICGDSHTCTNGGLGALAFGVGSSESTHALATQTLRQQKPKRMRFRFEGELAKGVTPKDLALHLIGRLGADAGVGYAIEYAGSTVRAMGIEGRLTLCNLTVELGAKCGIVAPDDITFAYLRAGALPHKGLRSTKPSRPGASSPPTRARSSIAKRWLTRHRWPQPSPGARVRSTPSPSTAWCPIRCLLPTLRHATECRLRSTTWGWFLAAASPGRKSTGSSSVPARTRDCPICATPPTSCVAARWHRA